MGPFGERVGQQGPDPVFPQQAPGTAPGGLDQAPVLGLAAVGAFCVGQVRGEEPALSGGVNVGGATGWPDADVADGMGLRPPARLLELRNIIDLFLNKKWSKILADYDARMVFLVWPSLYP